ncbi:hypothetical protein L1987_24429 [Smallanthus sonchifolius]|uniref:Uncharacterized protein n=1 Tax=Smallanthus sonchifolius TaxID=185202 RepID=A0ACB9IJM3_9ASTR|nr:hypothetical protein L1987_24429 [Smallanthus sonchifolius]
MISHRFHRHRLQMKTVSGKLVSTTPVNLFKSDDILSDFVTSDNGASQSVSAYLRRASAAFNEPAYFKKHRNLKKNRSNQEASTKSDISCKTLEKDEVRKVAGNSMKPESKKRRRTEAAE